MNYREIKEVNDLIDEIKSLDNFIVYIQPPVRIIKVSSNHKEVRLEDEHKTKVMRVLLEIRGELAKKLEELGVTEE